MMVINAQLHNNVSSMFATHSYLVWQTISGVSSKVDVLPPFPAGAAVFDTCVPVNTILQFTALLANGTLSPGRLLLPHSNVRIRTSRSHGV